MRSIACIAMHRNKRMHIHQKFCVLAPRGLLDPLSYTRHPHVVLIEHEYIHCVCSSELLLVHRLGSCASRSGGSAAILYAVRPSALAVVIVAPKLETAVEFVVRWLTLVCDCD